MLKLPAIAQPKKFGLSGLLLSGLLFLSFNSAAQIPPPEINRLVHLVRQDCGSCHGLRLTGGLGPSLLPEALKGKPSSYLVSVILDGLKGTPMPPWRGLLTEQEAQWIVERLQTEFPKD